MVIAGHGLVCWLVGHWLLGLNTTSDNRSEGATQFSIGSFELVY